MIRIEIEEVRQKDGENIIEQNIREYPVVIENNKQYIGVREDGEYRLFERNIVKSLHNDTGEVLNSDTKFSYKESPVIEAYTGDFSIIHGDLDNIE